MFRIEISYGTKNNEFRTAVATTNEFAAAKFEGWPLQR